MVGPERFYNRNPVYLCDVSSSLAHFLLHLSGENIGLLKMVRDSKHALFIYLLPTYSVQQFDASRRGKS